MTSKQSTDHFQSSLSVKLKSSSSNFCIDALLAKKVPIQASPSSESLNSESNLTSPQAYVPSPDSRSEQSPDLELNVGLNSASSLNGTDQSNDHLSSLWTLRSSTSLPVTHPLTSSSSSSSNHHQLHPHQNQNNSTSTSLSTPTPMSLFPPSVTNHPLYASLYGSLQNSNSSSSIGLSHQNPNLSLIHGSAFHSPLHEIKAHHSSAVLPLDWLTRAGLLYHRNAGNY